jgi:recombination protein RecA
LVKFVVTKNKLAAPFRSYLITLIFGEGIDYFSDLIDFAKMIGVIQQNGSYYRFEGETLGQGKAATRETLENSKETLDKVVEMVYNTVNKQPIVLDLLDEELEEGEPA